MADVSYEIEIINDDAGAVRILDAPVEVGREADWAIDDLAVSRRHVVLEPSPTGVVVRDLGSSNGTAVNGVRLSGPVVASPGDVVEIGSSRLLIRGVVATSAPTPPPLPAEHAVPPPLPAEHAVPPPLPAEHAVPPPLPGASQPEPSMTRPEAVPTPGQVVVTVPAASPKSVYFDIQDATGDRATSGWVQPGTTAEFDLPIDEPGVVCRIIVSGGTGDHLASPGQ